MTPSLWVPIVVGVCLVLGVLAVSVVLWWRGRTEDARALAGFVPDCVVLALRLLRDRRVGLARRLLVLLLIAYLANPLDLIPGSPIDDVLIAALVLGVVLRGQASLIEELWPGPPSSRDALLRLCKR